MIAPALIDGLKQKSDGDKPSAKARLLMIGALARNLPSADVALPVFTDVLRDENGSVRYYAIAGLDRLATPEARRTLDGYYSDHPGERPAAA